MVAWQLVGKIRDFQDFLGVVIDGWVRCDRESGTETEWRGAGADPPAPYVDESAPNAAEKSFGADVAEDVDVEGG